MRKLMLCLAVLGAFALAPAEGVKWRPSYQAALKEAKASKRLLMLDFYTDW